MRLHSDISEEAARALRRTCQAFCAAWRSFGFWLLLSLAMSLPASQLQAQSFTERTSVISFRYGSSLSDQMREVRRDGYELADGSPVSFRQWYASNRKDLQLTWLTELNANFGLLWGVSTGERGEKYHIQPGVKIGVLFRTDLSRNSSLSLSATTVLGGWLKEDSCVADYGAIGGVQTVNCRLAASALPPEETLQYLYNEAPADQVLLSLRYSFRF
ncbi:hypothetical protein [Candidatus Halocynthiibacter alkanivorans]|uniref:hypothetical protein n=1 Tax=Candidatus Halocynthiibacter alkanivorans TaxID=2267619 RepID=UPI000DF2E387|nr:hypothetical protein [Candidatus Halocynthiibacter alkanivorans]